MSVDWLGRVLKKLSKISTHGANQIGGIHSMVVWSHYWKNSK
ncbi:MAG: hypothetical protein ACTSRR_12940 [Candidatus Heimdallarchaeaceae archaeon]